MQLPDNDDELGFAGLIMAGKTPRQAWQIIHDQSMDPETQAIIKHLEDTEGGRIALQWSRDQWAKYGLNPPWEGECIPTGSE